MYNNFLIALFLLIHHPSSSSGNTENMNNYSIKRSIRLRNINDKYPTIFHDCRAAFHHFHRNHLNRHNHHSDRNFSSFYNHDIKCEQNRQLSSYSYSSINYSNTTRDIINKKHLNSHSKIKFARRDINNISFKVDGLNSSNNNNDDNSSFQHLDQRNQYFLHQIQCSMSRDIFKKLTHKDNHCNHAIFDDYNHVNNNFILLLCISGGCDSIALMHTILQIMKPNNSPAEYYTTSSNQMTFRLRDNDKLSDNNSQIIPCELHVVHFDHEQRGEESNLDRLLVQDLCHQYDIPFHCYYWNDCNNTINPDNKNRAKFSQEIARDWRRNTCIQLMTTLINKYHNRKQQHQLDSKLPSGLILTAHHKDDSEETILLKLLRGVHLTNLSGIQPLQFAGKKRISDNNNSETTTSHNNNDDNDENENQYYDIYFAKPMLQVRKSDIQYFLQSQGFQWRDDLSNSSDKYLRNRVRNELMPLLTDLLGGQEVLGRRIQNVESQSIQINEYLSQQSSGVRNKNCKDNLFPIPPKDTPFTIVKEYALYNWVKHESKGKLNLSYDKVTSVVHQITSFPDNRQWNIEVGSGWVISRIGDVLALSNSNIKRENKTLKMWSVEDVKLCTHEDHDRSFHRSLEFKHAILDIYIEEEWNRESIHFELRNVSGNENMRFVPPWRNNESKGIKIKDFLRGQKIPLHERKDISILCVSIAGKDTQLVAINFQNNTKSCSESLIDEKWMINAKFLAGGTKMIQYKILLRQLK